MFDARGKGLADVTQSSQTLRAIGSLLVSLLEQLLRAWSTISTRPGLWQLVSGVPLLCIDGVGYEENDRLSSVVAANYVLLPA